MDSGMTKPTTLEEQSEVVREVSEDILESFDSFLSYPKPYETDKKDISAPKLDAISQISEPLGRTEQNLREISQCLDKLAARIRQ